MISNEFIICPYCKTEHLKNVVLGASGLVNVSGTIRDVTCRKCGKDFSCEVDVKIVYKTRKFNARR